MDKAKFIVTKVIVPWYKLPLKWLGFNVKSKSVWVKPINQEDKEMADRLYNGFSTTYTK